MFIEGENQGYQLAQNRRGAYQTGSRESNAVAALNNAENDVLFEKQGKACKSRFSS
mgnify:CR=1 FL=1|jgi:hypothetical protein